MRRFMRLLVIVALLGGVAVAKDFGNSQDVKQVRTVVNAQFGKAVWASVSHDWALCTAFMGESDLSIVLHRVGSTWKVVAHDGGAFDKDTLRARGVPPADIPLLLKAYQ